MFTCVRACPLYLSTSTAHSLQIHITSYETPLSMVKNLLTKLTTKNKHLRQYLMASNGTACT
jgi:hypothetical protein